MTEYCYRVGGHCFSILADEGIDLARALAHYAPFAADPAEEVARVFRLRVVPEASLPAPDDRIEEFFQDDDGSQIRVCALPDGGSWLDFLLFGELAGQMRVFPGCREATLSLQRHPSFGLDNALMTLYAMSTATLRTALFHAAVVGFEGRGYLFLGKSGTGKSTHARLWLRAVPGSELLNDDNPVVRVEDDGTVRVYGSPWSGKTPCYRNVDLPVGGFVQLEQAPHNAIRPLPGILAYASLVGSISGKRWDRAQADGLHWTENALVGTVPVWHLDCLPDEAAARLCKETITAVQP